MKRVSYAVFTLMSLCALACIFARKRSTIPEEDQTAKTRRELALACLHDYPKLGPIKTDQQASQKYNEWIAYIRRHIQPAVDQYVCDGRVCAHLKTIRFSQHRTYWVDGPHGFMQWDVDTGALRGLCLSTMINSLCAQRKEAKLSVDQAIERAREYALKLVPDFDKLNLKFSKDDRYTTFKGKDGAIWTVTAFRWVKGFRTGESISIDFEEDLGFLNFGSAVYLNPTFLEQNITKEKALEIARPMAQKALEIAASDGWYNWAEGYKLDKPGDVELGVVRPNNFFEPGVGQDNYMDFMENRLAWTVIFWAKYQAKPGERAPAPVGVVIHVDAGTGKVIGGGF